MELNIVDLVLLICFLPGAVQGLRRGLVDQLIGLISLILGAFIAFRFSSALTVRLAPTFPGVDGKLINVLSFAILMAVVFVVLRILGGMLKKVISISTLGWLDRLCGFVFAILASALVIGLVLNLFNALNSTIHFVDQETLDASCLYNWIRSLCETVFPFIKKLFNA